MISRLGTIFLVMTLGLLTACDEFSAFSGPLYGGASATAPADDGGDDSSY